MNTEIEVLFEVVFETLDTVIEEEEKRTRKYLIEEAKKNIRKIYTKLQQNNTKK